eukprot:2830819-Ditylum_brightwellii.AAC.1
MTSPDPQKNCIAPSSPVTESPHTPPQSNQPLTHSQYAHAATILTQNTVPWVVVPRTLLSITPP